MLCGEVVDWFSFFPVLHVNLAHLNIAALYNVVVNLSIYDAILLVVYGRWANRVQYVVCFISHCAGEGVHLCLAILRRKPRNYRKHSKQYIHLGHPSGPVKSNQAQEGWLGNILSWCCPISQEWVALSTSGTIATKYACSMIVSESVLASLL